MQVLGIDIGGTGIKGAPVDTDRGVLLAERHRIPTPEVATPDAVAAVVRELVEQFQWKGPVGCTVPAVVEHGLVRTAANIHADWINTRVEDLLGAATGLRVTALNDADAVGVASSRFGAARGHQGLVFFVTVGTGLGTAILMRQQLVPNTELGHLEMHGMGAEEFCSSRARKRDGLSWGEWATRFQAYLDRIEMLFSPDLIVIGGGASRPDRVEKYFDRLSTRAQLLPATLQNAAGIIGAAWTAREALHGSNGGAGR